MNTDDKIIAMLRDTIERCESKNKPQKRKSPRTVALAVTALMLAPLTLYYSHNNQLLKSEITQLQEKRSIQNPLELFYFRRVLINSFIVEPNPFQCDNGLIQHMGDQFVCLKFT